MSKAYKKWLDDSQELADADLIDAVRVFCSKVEDVRRYLLGAGEEQLKMFGETPACLSVYNLCE